MSRASKITLLLGPAIAAFALVLPTATRPRPTSFPAGIATSTNNFHLV
jgi:hypothetical protein